MNNPSATIYHDFSTPSPAEEPATAETASASQPVGTGAKRGRPSGYAPRVADMLCEAVRQYGLSDSAAAELRGMSTTTISRWKKQFPELALRLQQARHQIRIHHLDKIMRHAEEENMRGLRASMWILERLFPQDYSSRMEERFAHRNFEDQQRVREDRAVAEEDRQELLAQQEARRAEAAQSAAAPPTASEDARPNADTPEPDAEPAKNASHSEDDSRNFRNSGEDAAAAANGDAAPLHTQHAATATERQQATAVQGAVALGAAPLGESAEVAGDLCAHSEEDSHYSRNSAAVAPGGGVPAGEATT